MLLAAADWSILLVPGGVVTIVLAQFAVYFKGREERRSDAEGRRIAAETAGSSAGARMAGRALDAYERQNEELRHELSEVRGDNRALRIELGEVKRELAGVKDDNQALHHELATLKRGV